jgi:ribosome-binding protein aMBF1 (putative translation factor)
MSRLRRSEYEVFRVVLRKAIDRSGKSQRQLSAELGMKSSYVNKILMGDRTVDIVELVDLARALDIDPVDLLRDALGRISG